MRRAPLPLFLLALAALGSGCATAPDPAADFVKPTIAVLKFENRAPFPLKWDLGTGTRDVLVDRLMATGRFRVVERGELDAVIRELRLQQSGLTREQERAAPGQLRNVQYMVKGAVTDFSHVAGAEGFLTTASLGLLGRANRAVMAVTLYVVEVETGQVVASETLQESVTAAELDVRVAYRGIAFGGSAFSQTPLGEATAKVIDRAVARISAVIAARPWVPKIAHLRTPDDGGGVILTGGRDRGAKVGDQLDVLESGPPILDPDTGDTLGHQSQRTLARLRVTEVHERHSIAHPAPATAPLRVGLPCRRLSTPQ